MEIGVVVKGEEQGRHHVTKGDGEPLSKPDGTYSFHGGEFRMLSPLKNTNSNFQAAKFFAKVNERKKLYAFPGKMKSNRFSFSACQGNEHSFFHSLTNLKEILAEQIEVIK